jgi:hypothetical protein
MKPMIGLRKILDLGDFLNSPERRLWYKTIYDGKVDCILKIFSGLRF